MAVQNQAFVTQLEEAGFSEKEALVYVSLLEMGGGFPSKISLYSGLNRSTVYQILLELCHRDLVNKVEKDKKQYFHIEKPEKMLRYARNKVTTAEDAVENVKRILPDIEALFNIGQNKPKITYFEGVEGVLSIYTDMITDQKPYEMVAFANADELKRFLPVKYFVDFVRIKAEIGITTRGILPDTLHDRHFNEMMYRNIDKKYWPILRFIPKEKFPLTGEITVYGEDKVSIVNFERNQMTGVVIKDRAIHMMMRTIFEMSWNSRDVSE